jgi:hypothetical protein
LIWRKMKGRRRERRGLRERMGWSRTEGFAGDVVVVVPAENA